MAWTSEMKVSFNATTDLSLSQQDLWCALYSMENMQNWYGILPDTRFRGKRHWQRDSYDDILEIRSEAFLSRLIIYSMRVMIWWSETILKFYELYREVYSILLILVFLFAFRWIISRVEKTARWRGLLVFYTSKATTLYTLARRLLLSRSRQAKFKKLRNRYPWDTRKKI